MAAAPAALFHYFIEIISLTRVASFRWPFIDTVTATIIAGYRGRVPAYKSRGSLRAIALLPCSYREKHAAAADAVRSGTRGKTRKKLLPPPARVSDWIKICETSFRVP